MSVQKLVDKTVLVDTSGVTPPAATTLNGGINNSVTAIVLTSGVNAVNGAYLTILAETSNTTETVLVVSGGGTVNLVVTRAQLGTAASAHSNAAVVNLPGSVIFDLLSIAQVPNHEIFVRKTSADIHYVLVRAATAGNGDNLFPGGGTTVLLSDNASNGTAHIKFPGSGTVLILLASGGGQAGPAGPAGASATAPLDVTITAFTLSQDQVPDGGYQPTFHLTVTPPGSGTFVGCHLYLEFPDQSATSSFAVGSGAIGTDALQGNWEPLDLGLFPYIAAQQPWRIPVPAGLDLSGSPSARIYAPSYSEAIDNTLVRAGLGGASPSATVTVIAPVQAKPASGTNVTPLTVTSISAVVLTAELVGGVLKRGIAIGVSLAGLPAVLPPKWGYQLLGFKDNDLTKDPVLASGIYTSEYTTGAPAPAGPDGISTPHTFGPDEPSAVMSITIYAVAGLTTFQATPSGLRPRGGGPEVWTPNNIIGGHTASVTVSIGTVTGVVDPTKFIAANVSPVFGNLAGLFDLLPLSVDATRQGLLAISSINLAALAVTNPKLALLAVDAAQLATSAVTATKIASLAVGTAAIANAAITNALIGNLAVGTANIQLLAVTDAQIGSLSVAKLTAGTISVAVSLTSPTITVTGSGYTINLDTTNGLKISGNNTTTTITNVTDALSGQPAGVKVLDTSTGWYATVCPRGFFMFDGSVAVAQMSQAGAGGSFKINNPSSGASINMVVSTSTPRIIMNGNTGFTGTLAAAIAAGLNVMGGIIY